MNKRIEIYRCIKDTHIKCFGIFHYNSGHTNPSKISQEDLNMVVTLPYLVNHIHDTSMGLYKDLSKIVTVKNANPSEHIFVKYTSCFFFTFT